MPLFIFQVSQQGIIVLANKAQGIEVYFLSLSCMLRSLRYRYYSVHVLRREKTSVEQFGFVEPPTSLIGEFNVYRVTTPERERERERESGKKPVVTRALVEGRYSWAWAGGEQDIVKCSFRGTLKKQGRRSKEEKKRISVGCRGLNRELEKEKRGKTSDDGQAKTQKTPVRPPADSGSSCHRRR